MTSNTIPIEDVQFAPSVRFASDLVEAAVTIHGGHVAPVTFHLPKRDVQPFSIAPWNPAECPPDADEVLRTLRGDFFCMPFGGNATPYKGEIHPAHGETAYRPWSVASIIRSEGNTTVRMSVDMQCRPAHVEKTLRLRDSDTALYSRNVVSGGRGKITIGHHPMLKFPEGEGTGVISLSPFKFGQVFPGAFERPEAQGYSFLKPGGRFESLERVRTITGELTDLTRFPSRRGWEDLVMLVSDDALPFAWTAVTFASEGYVWFSLKDPRVLRETVLWISNGGRYYAPWSGRHVNVMGLEEITGYFHYGVAESAEENPISREGFPTCVTLSPEAPLVVNYVMGVAAIPPGFDRVSDIVPVPGGVEIRSDSGQAATTSLDMDWLQDR